MLAKIKVFILKLTIPFQKWIQRRGRRETVITKPIVDRILAIAKQGDIIGSYESQRWTSRFIKGFYDHAALIVLYKGALHVLEAVGDLWVEENGVRVNKGGVRVVPLEEWLYKKDHVFLARTNLLSDLVDQVCLYALGFLGYNYDYYFSHENNLVYCSELELLAYRKFYSPFMAEIPEDKEILPQDYLDLCGKVSYLELLIDTRVE